VSLRKGSNHGMLGIRRQLVGVVIALIVGAGLAACGTGGPGNSSHQPNSCVGRPGGPCTPSEGGSGSGGKINKNGTINSGSTGNSGTTSNTNNSGAIVK
jgi:hypothetical protein